MAEAVIASKESGGEKTNDIEHVLDFETFIKLFTKEGCTNEDKLMQEILQPICALRNSGGGKLTIWSKENCSTRETEKCAEIIINAAENALSNTKKTDCIKEKCMNRLLIFSILGSQEVVTMNYNMYIVENDKVKLVQSTTSAAEVRLLRLHLQERKAESVQIAGNHEQEKIEDQTRPKKGQGTKAAGWIHGKNVKDQARRKEDPGPRAEGYDNKLSFGLHPSRKDLPLLVTLWQPNNPLKILSNHEEMVQGEKIKIPTTPVTVKFKMLKKRGFYSDQKHRTDGLTPDEYEVVLKHVSAFANHLGGRLYFGVASDGTVDGERLETNEIIGIRRGVNKKIESMVWPRDVNVERLWEICFLPVKLQKDIHPRYVIKISVDRCPGGLFVKDPESYHVVKNRVVKLPFSNWIARLERSTVETSDEAASGDYGGKMNINLGLGEFYAD